MHKIKNRSQREVESIASEYRPPIRMRDRVRPVRVHMPASSEPDRALRNCETNHDRRSGGKLFATAETRSRIAQPEKKLLIQFLADPDFMKKYEEVRSLLSQRLRTTSFEAVFEAVLDEFLQRHSPARRQQRRAARAKTAVAPEKRAAGRSAKPESPSRPHIPAAVRDNVHVRDRGQCTWMGANGKRCGSTQALQIDHIVPVASGGTNATSNLRLLCAKHNRMAATEILGESAARRANPPG